MQVFDKSGKPVEVADQDLPAAVQSGQFMVPKGTRVPINWDGQVGDVDASELPAALGGGARVASQQEFAQAERQEYLRQEYGGAGSTAAAAALGFADTATFGLGPALGGALGGEGAQKYMREVQEAHPTATTVGQVGGIVAPIIADVATAGAATPAVAGSLARVGARGVEAAELARAASGLTRAAEVGAEASRVANPTILQRAGQVLAAPQRALSAVGDLGEGAAQAILGKEGASLGTQLVQKAAALGARGAVEGGVIGGLENVKEQVLSENPGISGEKFLAAVGHGALLGGALGGGLGVGSVGLKAAARMAEPAIQRMADTAFVKALRGGSDLAREADEALAASGGLRGLRQRMVDDGVLQSFDTPLGVAGKVAQARVGAERELASELSKLDQQAKWATESGLRDIRQGPMAADLRSAIDREFPVSSKLGSLDEAPPVVRSLRKELDALAGAKEPELAEKTFKTVKLDPVRDKAELEDYVRKNVDKPDVQAYINSNGKVPITKQVEVPAPKAPIPDPGQGRLSFTEAGQAMNAILDLAEGASGAQRQKLLRLYDAVSGQVESDALKAASYGGQARAIDEGIAAWNKEVAATGKAPKGSPGQRIGDKAGEAIASAERDLGSAFQKAQQYRLADRYASKVLESAKSQAPKGFSLESLGGLGGAAGVASSLLGHGFLSGGVKGVAGKLAWDFVKERGPSAGAVLGGRIAGIEAVERAVTKLNTEVDRKINRIFQGRVEEAQAGFSKLKGAQADKFLVEHSMVPKLREEADQVAREIRDMRAVAAEKGVEPNEKVLKIKEDRLVELQSKISDLPRNAGQAATDAQKALFEKNRKDLLKWVSDVDAYERTMKLMAGYVPPGVASSVEKTSRRMLNYLMQEMPKPKDDPSQIVPGRMPFEPSGGEIARWNRQCGVAMNPLTYLDRIADGTLTPQERKAMEVCHPELKADMDAKLQAAAQAQAPAGGGKKGKKGEGKGKGGLGLTLAAEHGIKAALKLPQVNPMVSRALEPPEDARERGDKPGASGGMSSRPRGSGAGYQLRDASKTYALRGRGR